MHVTCAPIADTTPTCWWARSKQAASVNVTERLRYRVFCKKEKVNVIVFGFDTCITQGENTWLLIALG